MAKRSLAELKAAFAKSGSSNSSFDDSWKKFYPFWKMENGQQAVVRFLPDLDEENPINFLVENKTHELMVNGVKRKVACLEMYGETCPCCELSRKYYKEKEEDLGKKYYRKIEYIGQVIVKKSPIEVDPEPLIKLVGIGPKIHKLIVAAIQSEDLEEDPSSFEGGYDFRINKTEATGQGGKKYADYSTSSFSPKQTNVDPDLMEKLDLLDLKTQRTVKTDRPTMEAMLLADQTGKTFYDGDAPSENSTKNSGPAFEEDDIPFDKGSSNTAGTTESDPKSQNKPAEATTTVSPSERTKAIMERLKNRNSNAS